MQHNDRVSKNLSEAELTCVCVYVCACCPRADLNGSRLTEVKVCCQRQGGGDSMSHINGDKAAHTGSVLERK